jgi:hypothetical protein
MIEFMAAMNAAFLVVLSTAMLVHSGQKGWVATYNKANCENRLSALDTVVALGAIGRQSNKVDYYVYEVSGSVFQRALPVSDPVEVVTGQAVEFRYWNTELADELLDPAITATHYALLYLEDDELKADLGAFPPGALDGAGHRISGGDVTTITLARNVSSIEFSHTTRNMAGDGRGCVRMKLITTDPDDGSTTTTLAATLMRNVWPQ